MLYQLKNRKNHHGFKTLPLSIDYTLADEPYSNVSPYDILEYLLDGNRMSRPEHCSIEM